MGAKVIVGFKGTGYYVIFLLIVYYLTAFDPRRNPFQGEDTESTAPSWWEPNPIDTGILDFLRKKFASRRLGKYCTNLGDHLVMVREMSGPSIPGKVLECTHINT